MLHQMFKSVIDQDRAAVVICDTEHTIVYMKSGSSAELCKSWWSGIGWKESACLPQRAIK